MSADYIDFDADLQAKGYRAKTWGGGYFTIVAPDGVHIGTTPFESDIKLWAYDHYERMLEEAQALKKPLAEIWAFTDAPRELQDLSPHGGDEDYIVILRDESCSIAYQLEGGSFMGDDHWTKHEHNGEIVWIGAHA